MGLNAIPSSTDLAPLQAMRRNQFNRISKARTKRADRGHLAEHAKTRHGHGAADKSVAALFLKLEKKAVQIFKDLQGSKGLPPKTPKPGFEQTGQFTQLQFEFAIQMEFEEIVLFHRRVEQAASGHGEEARQTLIQSSRRVAARFEMSATFSAQSLRGFAGAAESLESDKALQALADLTDKLLAGAEDVSNEMFQLLEGFTHTIDGFGNGLEDIIDIFLNGSLPTLPANFGQLDSRITHVQLEFKFSISIEITQAQIQESDPIVFDLDGDGIELTSYRQGARFDIEASGRFVETGFVTGGDAFLALDRNGNGRIDNGGELFGDQRGAVNGFEELRRLDTNHDGVISKLDLDFARLMLFKDNGNGRTEAGELIDLIAAGIEEISLNYRNVDQRLGGGNRLAQTALFRRDDGTRGQVADAVLSFRA